MPGRGEPLPSFRHFIDPVAHEVLRRDEDAVCDACGRARGWIAESALYSDQVIDAEVCPWCIADGTAARRFEGHFNHVDKSLSPERAEIVVKRTPSLHTNDDFWSWPGHCDYPAIYVSDDVNEIKRHSDAVESSREFSRRVHDDDDDTIDERLEDEWLDVYLFRCCVCGTHIALWDAE